MHVLPYYRQISRGRKFDRRGTRLIWRPALQILFQFEAAKKILSVLIAHANTVQIGQSAKYASAKRE